MKKGNFLLIGLCLLVLGFSVIPAQAGSVTFSWSGNPIEGEDDPDFLPSGSAVFDITGFTLTITLTNTTSQQLTSIGQVLTILTWDITGASLTPLSAVIADGSMLVGTGATGATDLSSEWAFKDNLSAGSSPLGPIGSFGISAVGDINFGMDSFGPHDRFDTSTNLFPPPSGSLNGVDGGIVGPAVAFDANGFAHHGPVVQNQMVFTFEITGDLSTYEITNVQPFYGTDGAPTSVPEPATLTLLAAGLLAGAAFRKRLQIAICDNQTLNGPLAKRNPQPPSRRLDHLVR